VSAGGPDLFVICKNCGSEVSPYITECPYCGNRLRKRAPKLDRHGRISERVSRRPATPSLPRLRRGEIPGIRHDAHPYATILLLILGVIGCLVWRTSIVNVEQIVVRNHLESQWWRTFSSPFVYTNTAYAFVALAAIALYGTLMERRHGPIVVLALFLIGGVGGVAVGGLASPGVIVGGNGAALALLTAWAVPDLLRLARKQEIDGDMLATAVFALVLILMPLATGGLLASLLLGQASWAAGGVGVAAGLLLGYLLAKIHPV
jgi:membrane associated rhomboid family serine protease